MFFLKDIWEKRRFSKILTYGHICRTLGSKSIPHGVEFYILVERFVKIITMHLVSSLLFGSREE